jgi:PqqD family protein of HPr-rel-A system
VTGTGDSIRLAVTGALIWREWDDGCVVFNRATGETHYLDNFTSYLLRLVESAPRSAEELTATVCAELGQERADALEAQVAKALRNFEALALLEPGR